MRVVLYYPYIRTAHSSEKTVIFTNRKTAESENRHSKRMQRRGGNIPPHPKEANRKYPIDEARDCPRGPAERRKRKKTQSQSQVLRPFPAIRLRYATTQVRKPPVETPAHAHAPRIAAARGRHPAGRPLRTAAVVVSRRIPRLRYPGIARRRPERKPRHPGSHSAFRHDRHRTGTHSRSADRHSGRIRNHRPGTPL